MRPTVLLTHPPQSRRQYYGEASLRVLREVADVILHEADAALDAADRAKAKAPEPAPR